MIIVPNEWLVDLILGSVSNQRLIHRFLDSVDVGRHRFVLRNRSPLVEKLKRAVRDPQKRAKRLWLMVWDLDKVTWVEEHEVIALPDELRRIVPEDDRWLVEVAFTQKPCLLVTTDQRLLAALHPWEELRVQLLDEFLRDAV